MGGYPIARFSYFGESPRPEPDTMIYHVVKTQPSGTKHAIGVRHTAKYAAERYNAECQAHGLHTQVTPFKNTKEMSDWLKAHNTPFYAKNNQLAAYGLAA